MIPLATPPTPSFAGNAASSSRATLPSHASLPLWTKPGAHYALLARQLVLRPPGTVSLRHCCPEMFGCILGYAPGPTPDPALLRRSRAIADTTQRRRSTGPLHLACSVPDPDGAGRQRPSDRSSRPTLSPSDPEDWPSVRGGRIGSRHRKIPRSGSPSSSMVVATGFTPSLPPALALSGGCP